MAATASHNIKSGNSDQWLMLKYTLVVHTSVVSKLLTLLKHRFIDGKLKSPSD